MRHINRALRTTEKIKIKMSLPGIAVSYDILEP